MAGNPPTLINLPPHDAFTPTDVPGTPNSATTSMSELSTVAIKDGHRGHVPYTSHSHHPTAGTLDAERADRISRLAGLERITARNPTPLGNLTPGATAPPPGASGYFDAQGNPVLVRERSTVGSASATGSVGGRTTWASGSDVYDPTDKMSESQDMDMDTASVSGISDTNSLVAFGEGARTPARYSGYGSPSVGKATPTAPPPAFNASARDPSLTPVSGQTAAEQRDARNLDGVTYDSQIVDTATRTPEPRFPMGGTSSGVETAERIVQERLGANDANVDRTMESQGGASGLGKFYFEKQ